MPKTKQGPKICISMDGDQYRLTIPNGEDALWLSRYEQDHPEIQEFRHQSVFKKPYFARDITGKGELILLLDPNGTFSKMQQRVVPRMEKVLLRHNKGDSSGKIVYRDDQIGVRPMLIPMDEGSRVDLLSNRDGTIVYGGSVYDRITGQALSSCCYEDIPYDNSIYIGDTADCTNSLLTLPWIIRNGRLICMRLITKAQARELWVNGYI